MMSAQFTGGAYRLIGVDQGPPCSRGCNVHTVLRAIINGQPEWCCPACFPRPYWGLMPYA